MPDTFNPIPEVPEEIAQAADSGELVVFVGAGISRLVGCPSWQGLAKNILRQLVPKHIDHYELSQIESISDPKKKLSIALDIAQTCRVKIDFSVPFDIELKPNNVYSYLNSFNCSFVTTNYEKFLSPDARQAEQERNWRFYRRTDFLQVNLDHQGYVVHLHGCLENPDSMVVTTNDYLEHYLSVEVQEFLTYLFEKKTVLFIGYGLEETEVLEYIFRRGKALPDSRNKKINRFILQGFFNAEMALYRLLDNYYSNNFATNLIGFPKDYNDFAHQAAIIEAWSKKLKFGQVALVDEAVLLADEIRG